MTDSKDLILTSLYELGFLDKKGNPERDKDKRWRVTVNQAELILKDYKKTIMEEPIIEEVKDEVKDLTFIEAFEKLMQGFIISKREWNTETDYAYRKDGYAKIHLKDGDHTWLISDGDMNGKDWFLTGERVDLD